jgi:hypothetical protein
VGDPAQEKLVPKARWFTAPAREQGQQGDDR